MIRTVLVILAISLAACSLFKREVKSLAGNVVDCAGDEAKAAIDQYGPTVEHVVVTSLDAAGRADWEAIKSATSGFEAPTLGDAKRALTGCVMQAVITRLLDPVIDPDAPASSPLEVDKAELAHGWDQLREQRYGGAIFKGAQ